MGSTGTIVVCLEWLIFHLSEIIKTQIQPILADPNQVQKNCSVSYNYSQSYQNYYKIRVFYRLI